MAMVGLLWLELQQMDVKEILSSQKMVFPQFMSIINNQLSACEKFKQNKELISNM